MYSPEQTDTRRFATTIFSTTKRCNVGTMPVVTIRNNGATMLQRCVALTIVVANRRCKTTMLRVHQAFYT